MVLPPGQKSERSLGWYGWSLLGDIARDGKSVLFIEAGASGQDWGEYVRKIDGSPAVRIGDGAYGTFSPDGKWVAAVGPSETGDDTVVVIPVGAGTPPRLSIPKLVNLRLFSWLPDGRVLFTGAEVGHQSRTYAVPMDGGPAAPLTPEGVSGWLATPDNKYLISRVHGWELYPLAGGPPVKVKGPDCCVIVGWHSDGKRLRIADQELKNDVQVGWKLMLLDLSTGKTEHWKEITYGGDRAGVTNYFRPRFSDDGNVYAYSYNRILSQIVRTRPALLTPLCDSGHRATFITSSTMAHICRRGQKCNTLLFPQTINWRLRWPRLVALSRLKKEPPYSARAKNHEASMSSAPAKRE